jgi:predicted Zn-dependent protease
MKKILAQFALLLILFLGSWFLLSRIDFVEHLHVRQMTKESERKLGNLVLSEIRRTNSEIAADTVRDFVAGIKDRLCEHSGIADTSISVYVIVNDEVNAFALPGGNIIVYTGLIEYCKSPEELSGVLAHEIAHVEHGDVMKKLMRNIGFSMLTTIAGGNAGDEIGQDVVRLLSSSAFDREQETEADTAAVYMLARADIDPQYMANMLFRLSQERRNVPARFEWLSTHPNSQDRAAEIIKLRNEIHFRVSPVADSTSWSNVETIVRGSSESGSPEK